ncbi:hypothetical protein [Fodinibius sp. Rm-B-1B1-1]|uniref:hypothetical protein n=1 Tax=Fodinibius alkaliphilus TaxID=3140241 RepID=UPI003159C406
MKSNVAVYKTDVHQPSTARKIADIIQKQLVVCDVSFDLEDCDKVLRIEHNTREIDENAIQTILQKFGYQIEVLP